MHFCRFDQITLQQADISMTAPFDLDNPQKHSNEIFLMIGDNLNLSQLDQSLSDSDGSQESKRKEAKYTAALEDITINNDPSLGGQTEASLTDLLDG